MLYTVDNYLYFEESIKKLAMEYGLICKFISPYTCYIKSTINEWIVEIEDKLILKHNNKRRNCTRKYNTHKQREFLDFEFMFKSIRDHDKFKLGFKPKRRIDYLFDTLHSKEEHKISVC